MKPRINFVTIAVKDLDKSISFYRDGLGLPTKGIQDENSEHCLFELENNFSLVLYSRNEFLELTGHPFESETSAGFILSHIADSQAEVNSILEKALKAGAAQIGEVQDESWGYSVRFADPDGHQWEITYMPHLKVQSD